MAKPRRPRFNAWGSRMPVAVRIPGTNQYTERESVTNDGTLRCEQCGNAPRTLFNYDDVNKLFCRMGCWVEYLATPVISRSRKSRAEEKAVVQAAERELRRAARPVGMGVYIE